MSNGTILYVIFNGCNLYWYKGNDCEGWIDNFGQASWYFDRYDARQEAIRCGGQVISIDTMFI
jgi:hypothetical protein